MLEKVDTEIPADDDPDTFDSNCDPANPIAVEFPLILEAKERIKGIIEPTRCTYSQLSESLGMDLYLKREYELPTHSFKERGACNTLRSMTVEERKKGAVSASSGNHALAMSRHGKLLGMPITVCMPTTAPLLKIQNCLKNGANVVLKGNSVGDARKLALKLCKQRGMTYVNGYDHPYILAGQGTIGLEILEQVPDVEAVVVTVGGGGLIAGVARAIKSLKPDVKIYAAESARCPSWLNATKAGTPTFTPCDHTLADGLFVPVVGVNALKTGVPLIEKAVAVDESWICRAILRIVEVEKTVVEGAGATGVAAIMAGLLPELKGKKVATILCGANIDPFVFQRCIDRGLALERRLIKFSVDCSDRVGGLVSLLQYIAGLGVNLQKIQEERAWIKDDVFENRVYIIGETRGAEHSDEFSQSMKKKYPSFVPLAD